MLIFQRLKLYVCIPLYSIFSTFQNFLTCARKYRRLTQWDFLVFEHNWHELEDVIKTAKDLDVQVDIKVNRGDYGLLRSAEGKKHVSKVLGVEL